MDIYWNVLCFDSNCIVHNNKVFFKQQFKINLPICSKIFFLFSIKEKDPNYKEFTLFKSFIFVLSGLTLRGWSHVPVKYASRITFLT